MGLALIVIGVILWLALGWVVIGVILIVIGLILFLAPVRGTYGYSDWRGRRGPPV